jgi:hypothetical protein
MPVFFVLLTLLVIRSVTLPGSYAGFDFLFNFALSNTRPDGLGAKIILAFPMRRHDSIHAPRIVLVPSIVGEY